MPCPGVERARAGRPAEDSLCHMTDLRSRRWRAEQGLTEWQVDQRLDEAARIIGSCGSLLPVVWSVSEGKFNQLVRQFAPRRPHTGMEQPDYMAFLAFSICVLHLVHEERDDVECVDFCVERNDRITTRIEGFHARLVKNLKELDMAHLAALVGGFRPLPKEAIPAQAADVICWHARAAQNGSIDRFGIRRYAQMVWWAYGAKRKGIRNDWGDLILDEFHERLKEMLASEPLSAGT